VLKVEISYRVTISICLCGEFSPLGKKKQRAGESNIGNFGNCFLNRHILKKKILKVARLDNVLL
jgi:hypothetical protein